MSKRTACSVARGAAASAILLYGTMPAQADCDDVSWLDPSSPPAFLVDIDQAPGSGDCQFHEFASWNFMSLVLGRSPALATWPTTEQVFQVSGTPQCLGAPLGTGLTHITRQTGKGVSLDDIDEATGAPLVDQNGRYVQFEIRVDPSLCGGVSRCRLYEQSCTLAALGAQSQFRWPAGVAGKTPGVAEVKMAWRILETCTLPDSPKASCQPDDPTQFFWIGNVSVDAFSPKDPVAMSGLTIGLIGFHLIQKTPTHPEFIWATWEHRANAPVCPGSDNNACRDPQPQKLRYRHTQRMAAL
jgi:hypothetical protein